MVLAMSAAVWPLLGAGPETGQGGPPAPGTTGGAPSPSQPKPAARPGGAPAGKQAEATVPPTPDFGALGVTPSKVVEVLDARSLVVQGAKGQEVVSLLGVEEIKAAGDASAPVRALADALRDLTTGESVYAVDHESGARTDAQGRRACYVYRAPDGLMINLELIRQGYANASADFAYQHLEVFRVWQRRAATAGRGLHGANGSPGETAGAPSNDKPSTGGGVQPGAITPTGAQVFYTRNGAKYHTQGCRFATSATACTLSEAKAKGLTPCSQCNPPK